MGGVTGIGRWWSDLLEGVDGLYCRFAGGLRDCAVSALVRDVRRMLRT